MAQENFSAAASPSLERLGPIFFGPPERELYACHHFPLSAPARSSSAVVLCNGAGHEYERSHKTMRQLALLLARSGRHALRFDYYGTGDSAGECGEGSLFTWRGDIGTAIDECRRVTGCDRVTLVGLRLGATLAAQAAADRDDVEALVLLAPVVDAETLLEEWQRVHDEFYRTLGRGKGPDLDDELLGFPLSARFVAELREGLSIPEPRPTLRRVLLVPGASAVGSGEAANVAAALGRCGALVQLEADDGPEVWRRQPMEAIVPAKLLRRVIDWVRDTRDGGKA
jgi:pimeloyl-ACP methyl ester carboxylesterase